MGRSTLLLRADRRHEQSAPDCQVERHEPAALAEHAGGTIAQRSPYELIYDAPARERLAAMAGSAAALTR
jgi:hypothetical protein